MKKRIKWMGVSMLGLCLVMTLFVTVRADAPITSVAILFTHDLHSHLLPAAEESGGEYGGYARLMTVINGEREKYPDVILVGGGDFSRGSLFQTAYATCGIELRMMGAMGYDTTTFGNYEYDYLPSGFVSMLNAAANSGDPVPAILEANYLPPMEGEAGCTADSEAVWSDFRSGIDDQSL